MAAIHMLQQATYILFTSLVIEGIAQRDAELTHFLTYA